MVSNERVLNSSYLFFISGILHIVVSIITSDLLTITVTTFAFGICILLAGFTKNGDKKRIEHLEEYNL
ncbi:unnamed protein product, partial [marine sediment metagenome]